VKAAGLRVSDEPSMVSTELLELMGCGSEAANRRAYRPYMRSMVSEDDDTLLEALHASPYAVGDKDFVEQVTGEMRAELAGDERRTDVLWEEEAPVPVERIEKQVAKAFRVKVADLHEHGNHAREAKAVAIELACRVGRLNHRAAGRHFGISGSAVGKQRQRLAARLADCPERAATMQRLARKLGHP